jgi:GTP cyclohydrolase I
MTVNGKVCLTWDDVFQKLASLPPGKLYGIPRGGAIVAALSNRFVETPEEADLIVDDIIDSGRTAERYTMLYGKPVVALIDKRNGHDGWIQFPWEEADPTKDLADTVIRKLEYIGEDPTRDGLRDTPRRVIKAFTEMTSGYKEEPAAILSKVFDVVYDEIVILKDIGFWSLCEHHLLPFHGKIHIGYLPSGKVVGISKLARLAFAFSRRLQVQERLTQDIANSINENLKPQGVGVVIEATHLCMAARGVQAPATMVTSCLLGTFRDRCRHEFLDLIRSFPPK